MAPAPVIIVDGNDVDVAAGNHIGEISPEVDQNGRTVLK
jgi:hypothetical protein